MSIRQRRPQHELEGDVSRSTVRMTHRLQYRPCMVCVVDMESGTPEKMYVRQAAKRSRPRPCPRHVFLDMLPGDTVTCFSVDSVV